MKNARGRVYYGMHFYPGICEYHPPGRRPFRVFLNEDTIRKMDSTFAGRPVYVHHPDEPISQNLDIVRGEADGWVIRSFYNEKDGKHWTQFIVVTDAGELAIRKGWKLSNCYEGQRFGEGGMWNGMEYDKEILEGEYEHLAIVPDPRYEESIVLTPEEFKHYNDTKDLELKRLANSKEKSKMGFKIFTRKFLESKGLLKNAYVALPSSGREVSILELVKDADKAEKTGGKFVNSKALVKFEGQKMTVAELMEAHSEALDAIESLKDKLKNSKKNNVAGGYKANEKDDEDDMDEDDEELENESDEWDLDMENESDDEDKDDDEDDSGKKKQKNKKTKNSRRSNESSSGDDFETGIFENDSDEDDEDGDDEETSRDQRRRVNSRRADLLEDDEDDTEETQQRRQRNSRGERRRQEKRVKNSKKKKSDKEKADRLRNAHTKSYEPERYGDGLDPLQRGQAMFGSQQAK